MRGRRSAAALTLVITVGAATAGMAAAPAGARTGTAPAVAPAADTSPTFVSLKLGSKGDRVRQVQEKLRANGASILADGVFGPKTRTAVRKFQKAKGLRVDGVVGPVTWRALGLTDTAPEADPPTIPEGSYRHPYANVERWHDDALAAGWPDSQWQRLSCIIYRESKGIPTAKNPSGAMGLMQIMWSVHSKWIGGSSSQLFDGPTNLRFGRQLYVRAGGWGPWVSTSSKC